MSIALLSAVILLAIGALVIQKTVPAIISFVLMMAVLGLYYISLDARLLGLFQIFVYTGGIMVLMLFGVTIIGTEFPKAASRPYAAASAFLVFIALGALLFKNLDNITLLTQAKTEEVDLFTHGFSDYLLVFALIASSLLYGTVKMAHVLKAKRSQDV